VVRISRAAHRRDGGRPAEEGVEEAVHLALVHLALDVVDPSVLTAPPPCIALEPVIIGSELEYISHISTESMSVNSLRAHPEPWTQLLILKGFSRMGARVAV